MVARGGGEGELTCWVCGSTSSTFVRRRDPTFLIIEPKQTEPELQGYLAHKKQRPPRTLQQDSAQGPMVVLGDGAISHVRGTPVACLLPEYRKGYRRLSGLVSPSPAPRVPRHLLLFVETSTRSLYQRVDE